MYRITMFRDRIVLNPQLKSHLINTLAQPAPAGQQGNRKILLAAREISIQDGYTFELPDCDLVMVADHYDTTNGTIKLTVTTVPADGLPGHAGRKLNIICRNWQGGTGFMLKGGIGGKGLRGATGAPGKDGISTATGNDGGDGGKGGTGLTGGAGGKGGTLAISYITKQISGITSPLTLVPGGPGGAGGPGGFGGPGGEGVEWCKPNGTFCVMGTNGKTGPVGNTGSVGATGANGIYTATSLIAANYKAALAAVEVPLKEWADYRFAIGEYYYRAFGYHNQSYLKIAQDEFDRVKELDPANTHATAYRNQLLGNMNILGLSRYADVIPDFDRYEEVYTKYHGMVHGIFQSASNMLLSEVQLTQKKKDLEREVAALDGIIDALTSDLNAATIGKDIADKEVIRANQRIEEIKKKVEERKEELANAQVDVLGIVIGVVGAVVSVIAAIPTMGTSLVGAATSIAVILDTVESAGVGEIIKQATNPDADQTELDKLKKEAKGLPGFIEEISKGVKTIISFTKMMEDANQSNVEDEEYRALIQQAIEFAHQQVIAQMHQGQAIFALQAAQKRLTQAQANKAAAQQQLAALSSDVKVLENASFSLIRIAQQYMNILTKYAFFAARSLEIYTLVDKSKDIRFDYGYIHPDKIANYKSGLISLTTLIAAYQQSWSTFANLLNYRQQYDNYFTVGSWVYDYHKVSFKDTAILNKFKSSAELNFAVRLSDLPSSRYEAKAETVYVAFVGATSNSDAITAIVEHTGSYSEKKRNGNIIEATLLPRKGVVIAKQSALTSDIGVLDGSEPGIDFWGRGVAADWRLYIEKEELANANINLANIAEIQVWFVYQSFLVSASAQDSPASLKDGTLVQDAAGNLYVISRGAKLAIRDINLRKELGLENAIVDTLMIAETIGNMPVLSFSKTRTQTRLIQQRSIVSKDVFTEVSSREALDQAGGRMVSGAQMAETTGERSGTNQQ
ncbi:hypothetical protein EXU57_14390 [Segetibacter sp. 3557_3]|uniref:hypothetical protein n=1 Tax=Segetibacter sp. 3557_3 TaxID=2547429 RepID=UPI0010587777|nr:hypothetical protein [Segetibacter sp. 3557_3]TDH24531.1 hypothetical protein EXU57_14390 [Segetibacter sp. 3557_3]